MIVGRIGGIEGHCWYCERKGEVALYLPVLPMQGKSVFIVGMIIPSDGYINLYTQNKKYYSSIT